VGERICMRAESVAAGDVQGKRRKGQYAPPSFETYHDGQAIQTHVSHGFGSRVVLVVKVAMPVV
jgi:hypothetical protein